MKDLGIEDWLGLAALILFVAALGMWTLGIWVDVRWKETAGVAGVGGMLASVIAFIIAGVATHKSKG